jgi:uncharacterized protein (DUF302 family)
MIRSTVVAALMLALPLTAGAAEGLVATESPHSVEGTMERLEKNARSRDLEIFARIDHADGAAKIGETMRPTALLVFGNPKGGTPFMQCAQTIGIDLPLKALVWQDANGRVWLGYDDPAYIAERHGAEDCPAIAPIAKALTGLVEATIAP